MNVRHAWLVVVLAAAPASAHESSSSRYTNVSLGGATAGSVEPETVPVTGSRTAPRKTATVKPVTVNPTKLPEPAPVATAAAPVPAPRPVVPLAVVALVAAGLVAAGVVVWRRRSSAHRRAGDEALALAAHELQSPLAAIESYLDLMASEAPGGGEARVWLEDVARMKTTTAHLRRTIGDILDMTRVEDGRMKLEAGPIDAGALSRAVAMSYAAQAQERGIALTVEAGEAKAVADSGRLRQILDNLVSNALKYTPSGKAVVVSTAARGGDVVFEVRDAGVGVPEAGRSRLFGKFARLGPAVDGAEGTGLGLYLSRRLAAAMKGSLDYEPRPGGGSIFRLVLPRA